MEATGSEGEALTEKDFEVMVDMGYGRVVPKSKISGAISFSGANVSLSKSGQEKFERATLQDFLNFTQKLYIVKKEQLMVKY